MYSYVLSILIMMTAIVILGEIWKYNNKANLRDLIAATGLVILLKLDSNRRLFSPCDLAIWWMTLKIIGQLSNITPSFVHHHDDVIKWKYFPRYWPFVRGIHRSPVNSPHKGQWRGTLMFSLTYAWIRGWVNHREAGDLRRHQAHYDLIVMISHPSVNSNKIYCPQSSIRVKIGQFLYRVTFKFDGWPWKTIGHLFYTTLSFVHHLKAICGFKRALQFGNT